MVRLQLQTKREHLRKEKNKKKYIRTNRTGFIRWRTGFIQQWTGFICPADEASPPADEASPPANEAQSFGPYIFTKLAIYSLFFQDKHSKIVKYPFKNCTAPYNCMPWE